SADAVLETRLEGYRNDPTAVTGDDRAARNRVTLTARIVLRRTAPEASDVAPLLDRSFSSFADYDPARGADGEAEAARVALRAIADDAFTAATSNW
ncbi:MAG TPA: LPS assembly lipoprotein LptE, partial [Rhodothermales bacterium]|nr:LPS assembly lipoprotein LptE [Rhodothermales bacterium]